MLRELVHGSLQLILDMLYATLQLEILLLQFRYLLNLSLHLLQVDLELLHLILMDILHALQPHFALAFKALDFLFTLDL